MLNSIDRPGPEAARVPGILAADLPTWRKYLIVFVVSWAGLVATFSSTSILIATPEIAADLSTTSEILNVTNAGVLVAMGLSSLIWSPLSDIFSRRRIYNIAILFFFVPSIGAAVAPNMATFTAMRILAGLTGTYFMVAGQTFIADIFEPVCAISVSRSPVTVISWGSSMRYFCSDVDSLSS
jgi:MFS family permease